MEKALNQIQQALQKLMGLHRQLLDSVRLEKTALVQADLKGIQEATVAKQMLIEGIQLAEAERLRGTTELAVALKKPLRDLTLPKLIIHLQGSGPGSDSKRAEQLRSTYNALTILIKHIADQNEDNRLLVERSLEHIHAMKQNVIGEAAPRNDVYTAQGQKANPAGNSRLFSKEA